METVEKSAETIEAAVEAGLRELGVSADEVMVEVIEEPSRGVFGIGAKPARVRIVFMGRRPEPPAPIVAEPAKPSQPRRDRPRDTSQTKDRNRRPRPERSGSRHDREPREQRDRSTRYDDFDVEFEDPEDLEFSPTAEIIPDERADEMALVGKRLLVELLEKMGFESSVTIHKSESTREGEETLWILNVAGKNASTLVGRRGDTLASLQYIVRLMLSRQLQRRASVIVDVAEYKLRRTDRLRQLASRMADQAIKQGRTVTLEPMPPNERRIIHLALKERPDVQTKSIGEGNARKVTISPIRA